MSGDMYDSLADSVAFLSVCREFSQQLQAFVFAKQSAIFMVAHEDHYINIYYEC